MDGRTSLLVACVLAAASGGCSSASSAAPGNGANGSDGGDVGSSDDGGASDDAAKPGKQPCTQPVDQRPDGGTCVLDAKGSVTDLAGAPLGGLVMTFCGSVCFGTQSDATGSFDIPIGTFINRENFAIHADGRPDHAVTYIRMTPGNAEVIALTAPIALPTLPPSTVKLPADKAAASSVTVGDLTLAIADGTTFDLDIEDFGTDAGRTLRVAPVSLANAPDFAATAKVAAIYALAPSGAKSSSPMGVTLANSALLTAGAAVEILVLGDDYLSTPPTVGIMSVAATAHVSSDGKTIQTDPGQGIGELTWLGVRLKGS